MKCAPHKQSPVFSIKARTCGSIATNTPRPGNRLGDEIYNNNKNLLDFSAEQSLPESCQIPVELDFGQPLGERAIPTHVQQGA